MVLSLQINLRVMKDLKSKLAILGSGGHGIDVADAAYASGWEEIYFYDDNEDTHKSKKFKIHGCSEQLIDDINLYDGVVVAIADNHARIKKINLLSRMEANLVNVIHPCTSLSSDVIIHHGCVLLSNCSIQPGNEIGYGSIISVNVLLGHNVCLGAGVHISPSSNILGNVRIENNSWIGSNSTIKEGVKIASNVIIGASSLVLENIDEAGTYVGSPVRKL